MHTDNVMLHARKSGMETTESNRMQEKRESWRV